MRWICPTCERELAVYQTECPHCVIPVSKNDAPPETTAGAAEHIHTVGETSEAIAAAQLQEATSAHTTEQTAQAQGDASTYAAVETAEGPVSTSPQEETTAIRRGFFGQPRYIRWSAYLGVGVAAGVLAAVVWSARQVTVRVNSEPAGATVLLDSKRAGQTPLELTALRPGQHYKIRLELADYQPAEENFVAKARQKPLAITLKHLFDPSLDEKVAQELVGQIGESARQTIFSHELAESLFTVNPLIEQNPWLTDSTWSEIFRQVVNEQFNGNSEEFLRHLRTYRAELAAGKTSKQAWYEHLQHCEKICRPVVTAIFKRHIQWLQRSGFTVVYFPVNRSELTDKDTTLIDKFVAEHDLARDHSQQVLLVGRASPIGAQQYNLELSRKRVESVAAELAAQLDDAQARLRRVHLGFEAPQITPAVAEILKLDLSLSQDERNQSVMLIVSEPLPSKASSN